MIYANQRRAQTLARAHFTHRGLSCARGRASANARTNTHMQDCSSFCRQLGVDCLCACWPQRREHLLGPNNGIPRVIAHMRTCTHGRAHEHTQTSMRSHTHARQPLQSYTASHIGANAHMGTPTHAHTHASRTLQLRGSKLKLFLST